MDSSRPYIDFTNPTYFFVRSGTDQISNNQHWILLSRKPYIMAMNVEWIDKRTYVSLIHMAIIIWQTHSKTTFIMFTICKKNMLFSFKKWIINYFVTFILPADIYELFRMLRLNLTLLYVGQVFIIKRTEFL